MLGGWTEVTAVAAEVWDLGADGVVSCPSVPISLLSLAYLCSAGVAPVAVDCS